MDRPHTFLGIESSCDDSAAAVVRASEGSGRVLSSVDVARAAQAPVVATVEIDPSVARLVDSGLLTGRLPRSLDPLRLAA